MRIKLPLNKDLGRLYLGPLAFVLVIFLLWGNDICTFKQSVALGTVVWMGLWWVLHPVHIAITAFVPIPINALFDLIPTNHLISQYFSEIVVLLLGSELISLTWEKTHLDRRLAIGSLCCIGTSLKSQVFVWLVASTLLSIILPNVVVVMIFLPVAISMLKFLGEKDTQRSAAATVILLAIVWGAGIGGFGSPLGGSANLVAVSYIEGLIGHEFMYMDWVYRFMPILALVFVLNLLILFRLCPKGKHLKGGAEYFRQAYAEFGRMSRGEKIAMWLFVFATVLAFARPLYAEWFPALKPAFVFFIFGMLTFVLRDEGGWMLTWRDAEKGLMWGMIFMFAGGLALGRLITETDAAMVIAQGLTQLSLDGGFETMLSVAFLGTFLTEISSNTAAASISIPVVLSLTQELMLNPIPYLLVTIVAVNCAYILPVSIRAIGVSYGLSTDALLKEGVKLSILTMLFVSLIGYLAMKFWPMFVTLD